MSQVCDEWNRDRNGPCQSTPTERTPAGRDLCHKHADAFWAQRERVNRDYPDTPHAPLWFDPADAGEQW